jgi:hypothetical protein
LGAPAALELSRAFFQIWIGKRRLPQEQTFRTLSRDLGSRIAGSWITYARSNLAPTARELITDIGVLDGNPKHQCYQDDDQGVLD